MLSSLAHTALCAALALAPVTAPASAPPASAPAAAQPARDYLVHIDLGPELARRMGVRVILRPAGDNFGNRRAAVALDLPRPTAADSPPGPASARLPAGLWRIEATAPGFLASTREVTVDPTTPEQTLRWALLPDSNHSDVRFIVSATGTPVVRLHLRSDDGARSESCLSQRSPCTLRLTPGVWHLEATAPGFQATQRSFTVVRGAPLELPLELAAGNDMAPGTGPKGHVPMDTRKRLALALGLTAAPLFAAGLGLTLSGRLQYVDALHGDPCHGPYRVRCGAAVLGPAHRASAGLGLLGAAAGLLVTGATSLTGATGLTGLTSLSSTSRTAWWVELGLGGALTVTGIGWLAGNSVAFTHAYRDGPITDLAARGDRRLAPSLLLGLGLGALAGATTGLLVQRHAAHLAGRLTPYAAAGQAGLVWHGRF